MQSDRLQSGNCIRSQSKKKMYSPSRNIVAQVKKLPKVTGGCFIRKQTYATPPAATASAVFPGAIESTTTEPEVEWDKAIPYDKIPGPKPIPILGNTFR